MFSQFSNSFVVSSSFLSVLIENSAALFHQASTFLIFAMNDFTDIFFNENFISILRSSNIFSKNQSKIQCSQYVILLEHFQIKNMRIIIMFHHLKKSSCSNSDQKHNSDIYKIMFDSEMSSILIST